jgi:predicted MFS family arabinose efflux permease
MMIAFGPRPTLRRMVAGAGAFGIALVGLSFSTNVIVSLLLMVLLGWALIAMAATINTTIQLDAPDLLRGRVMSIYTTVFAGSTPLGGIFSGTVASLAGAPMALLIGGVLTLLTAAVALSRLPGLLVPAAGTVAGRKPS